MSNFPDDMDWKAYERVYGANPKEDEISDREDRFVELHAALARLGKAVKTCLDAGDHSPVPGYDLEDIFDDCMIEWEPYKKACAY